MSDERQNCEDCCDGCVEQNPLLPDAAGLQIRIGLLQLMVQELSKDRFMTKAEAIDFGIASGRSFTLYKHPALKGYLLPQWQLMYTDNIKTMRDE